MVLHLNVKNETSRLRVVVLGTAKESGPIPELEDCYDPTSCAHIRYGTYPEEEDMILEMDSLFRIFEKYDVAVYRPDVKKGINQIFARDIAFVIEDKIVKANILPYREKEVSALDSIWNQVTEENRIVLSEVCHIEGGDVIVYNDYIFVGVYSGIDYIDLITARTNLDAVISLQELFPDKVVKSFELRKSNTNPRANALHLDCCLNIIGKDKIILHRNSFMAESEYQWLVNFFGIQNIFEITDDEKEVLTTNIFSISEKVVVSDKRFTRLNTWLKKEGFIVEEIKYSEVGKQGGLIRCSTMPLIRD